MSQRPNRIRGAKTARSHDVLTAEALAFVEELHRTFDARRREMLGLRAVRQARLDAGEVPDFLPETEAVRRGDWKISPAPPDLQDRRVEITGPVDRKMMINAFNSGAKAFMADFEDALSPTWENVVEGQANLMDAARRTLGFRKDDGTVYQLGDNPATLIVRPRGWHLEEKHALVGGEPVCASLFDFGLFVFHNAAELRIRGTGPYLYIPKLENHLEARLWNDAFAWSEQRLGLRNGTIRATVLIETVLAALEMDEILWELRDHAAGLNAGRWDYIFSVIKKFRESPDVLFPDRAQLTMTAPFMRAYTDLLVGTCHKRGAHAIGGMAADVPNRKDPRATERALARVREDKLRESGQGFDGTWVAHPDLVPVAMAAFNQALGAKANQLDTLRHDVHVGAKQLLGFHVPAGRITADGLRTNVDVGIRYLSAWLSGNGAAAIHNLMEDAATAEIARSQVWQWVRRGARLDDGRAVTPQLVRAAVDEESRKLASALGPEAFRGRRFPEAREMFEQVALGHPFVDFITLPAYERLERPME